MAEFKVRALEIHSQYAWDFHYVRQTIGFMKTHGLNTLIFHRNDFIDQIIFPGQYFGARRDKYENYAERYQDIYRALKKYTPTRKNAPLQRRGYLKRVLEEARRAGIEVFIENKELHFPDIILEFFPQLVKEGKTCPSDPFWWAFIRTKYTEFFEEFPDVGGIVTSPASGESRSTIAYTRCTCDGRRNASIEDWYSELIQAIYEPCAAAGKKLIIRDFVFDSKSHNQIASVMEQPPADIGAALKNTPHDYFPTFPDNTRIGKVGGREQWIEFDVWGQFFGWGVAPSIMIDDLRHRMNYAKERGADGIMLRVDWEHLDSHSAFETLNIVNLYAGARLADDLTADNGSIYRQWLEESGYYRAGADDGEKRRTAAWIGGILDRTWDVVRRTAFVNDLVFSDSSHWPVSLEIADWLAEETYSLQDWDASKADAFRADEANVRRIMAEKDEALRLVNELSRELERGGDGLGGEAQRLLRDSFVVFVQYVEAFRLATHSIILTKYIVHPASDAQSGFYNECRKPLEQNLQAMPLFAAQLDRFFADTSHMYRAYTLLDSTRMRALHGDLNRQLAQMKIRS